MHTITVQVNGIQETHRVADNQTLLSFLRDTLNLTGAKEGCNEGECGACMVLVNGKAVNSCLMLAVEADGCDILTIEGLGSSETLHPVQQAFIDHHAVQCGFCSPGMILTTVALLAQNNNPSDEEIKQTLAGNLCRCTGYQQIIAAVKSAAATMNAQQAAASRSQP